MDHLDKLEAKSVHILREAYAAFGNLCMLWSIGKDSTVLLWLARKAFYGHVPFPLVHVDTHYKIPEMIEYRDRPDGSESKLNTYSDGFKVLRTIFRLYKNYKPLPFFGALALIIAIISTGFFIPIIIEFFMTGLVAKTPTLIVCGCLYLIAIHSFFGGLILDVIIQKDRQRFELDLNSFKNWQRLKIRQNEDNLDETKSGIL